MSIRLRILVGCAALTLLTAWLGLFAQQAERRLGRIALDIYDDAFMSVTYLRDAQIAFETIAAHPNSKDAAAGSGLLADLSVVRDRAMSPRGRAASVALIGRVRASLPLLAAGHGDASAIDAAFDDLAEVYADDGFRYRHTVSATIKQLLWRNAAAIVASLLAALAITFLLGRAIVPPVQRAVRVAQSIAGGRLDNVIDTGGRGETGHLLRALSTMQASIAAAMARIQALLDSQAQRHADEIATQNARMDAALQNMSQGLCLFGPDGSLLVANRRFAQMFGAPEIGAGSDAVLRGAGMAALVGAAPHGELAALTFDLPDGRGIAVSQHPVEGGGWVATYEDTSERREQEAQLAHMARHDTLTGLGNRLLFAELMRETLARHASVGPVAVLCLNLGRFKPINEALGHAAGDALLQEVARRLQACLSEHGYAIRLGGDEFAVVQGGIGTPEDAGAFATRLIDALSQPYELPPGSATIGVTVGVALSNAEDTPESLLKAADLALNRARTGSGNSYQFFEAEMDLRMRARRALEEDLRAAVADLAFEVFYQPLVDAAGGITGFEALMRWPHPARGMVSPAIFIPVAEETGLIATLGTWMLRRACVDCAAWGEGLKVAVNLSPLQFRSGRLEREVTDALAASGLSPNRLELEITESVLLQDSEETVATLHALRALGVRIAMDDFGTGYSSLGYLRSFPFDKIKIDQSFIRGLGESADCLAIVRAVIGLGRSLSIRINAEGVETDAQRDLLHREGCNELQGFLFSRPQPNAEVRGLIERLGATHSAASWAA